MIHDPLCPYRPSKIQCSKDHGCSSGIIIPESEVKCQCDLIKVVRDDQRRRDAAGELTRLAQDMGMIP